MKLVRHMAIALALITLTTMRASAQTTEEVWNHHMAAWDSQDLNAIMDDYTEKSLLIVNNEIVRGKDNIRAVFARLFDLFSRGQNRIDPATLDGRIVYITWHFTPQDDQEYFGTDTFVVEDGTISVQTIASPLYDRYSITDSLPAPARARQARAEP
jgi:predicted SnoaL-like aldol condensation-catalyzing enzyme